jgi:predicted nucleic acid-binding protein
MNVVLDASAAVELLLGRPAAKAVAGELGRADVVVAPTLYVTELANVFWKYHRLQKLPQALCEQAILRGRELVDELMPDEDICEAAFRLACQTGCTVYDALYLETARRSMADVLTCDAGMRRIAAGIRLRVPSLE